MRRQPHLERRWRDRGQDLAHAVGIIDQPLLRKADPESGFHHLPGRRQAVGTDDEIVARQLIAHGLGGGDLDVRPVESDKIVIKQVVHGLRGAADAQIGLMGSGHQLHLTDLLGDQLELGWPEHANGNVRFAQQQVVGRIRGNDFEGDGGEFAPHRPQQFGQDIMRHHA